MKGGPVMANPTKGICEGTAWEWKAWWALHVVFGLKK